MTLRAFILLLLAALTFGSAPAGAQTPDSGAATLVADKVWVDGKDTLTAEGHVEILYGVTRIKASRIIYSGTDGSLQIDGPITLIDGDDILILANSAQMDGDLRNGILRGARMVLNQQVQLAAAEINRVDGRYTQLYKTVASSCQVCANNPVPLWQIRARRIIHDQQERQLYFDDAVLQIAGVPVFYLPRLRLPDPTLKRATGFLVPTFKSTSQLGWGIKVPYFIKLGDHADITLTPYLSAATTTMELRFRHAFRTGDISFYSAFTHDDIRPGQDRGYFFGQGRFDLPRDFVLKFSLETSSDRDYLLDYGYSNKDRLESGIEISRARRDELIVAEALHYHSLRGTENNDTLPTVVGNLVYHRRYHPDSIGGELGLRFDAHSHYRTSSLAGDSGRDLTRASFRLDWKRGWTLRNGMVASVLGEVNADYYNIEQGLPGEFNGTHITPAAMVELRWPFVKITRLGASHVIEPVVQLVWTDTNSVNIPDEDSRLVEFDQANLFSLSRFPGADRYERGFRANVGVTWTRYDPTGWSLGLTVGRIFREKDLGQFQASTGLSGQNSDWLAAVQLQLRNNLTLTNRSIFDNKFNFAKNETRLTWQTAKLGLDTSYIWMEAEPYEDRPNDTSEWTFDAAYKLAPNWTGKMDWRYDFIAGEAAYAGVGLEYRSECVKIDLSLSRRFTSSGSLTPTTDFGLTVSLTGFGSGNSGRTSARRCQTYK
ncbi:LPS-assembly protein LptD [Profundibacter sp.]|uniref:LPS-assembly protein LptD n=1 Tax=Profundibacter sp. TaxID=3101071 RepID=UPI003D15076A